MALESDPHRSGQFAATGQLYLKAVDVALKRGEFLSEWIRPDAAFDLRIQAFTECTGCTSQPFRIMIIESDGGTRRGISVCKDHFEEAAERRTPSL